MFNKRAICQFFLLLVMGNTILAKENSSVIENFRKSNVVSNQRVSNLSRLGVGLSNLCTGGMSGLFI